DGVDRLVAGSRSSGLVGAGRRSPLLRVVGVRRGVTRIGGLRRRQRGRQPRSLRCRGTCHVSVPSWSGDGDAAKTRGGLATLDDEARVEVDAGTHRGLLLELAQVVGVETAVGDAEDTG